jgi:ABC-2 type transport system ATP-binding protein
VRLFGRDPQAGARALEGVAGFVEAPRFYPYLSGRKNLEMLAAFDGGDAPSRIDAVLETVELTGRAHDRVGGYSHGMGQRLGIASALLRDPKLLLLDEPATGLDPGGMRDMRVLVRRLADEGMTVLLSSHLMTEVEELCNRVAIVRSGSIVYEGEIAELKRTAGGSYRLRTTNNDRALELCAAHAGINDARRDGDGIRFSASEEVVGELSRALVEANALILALTPETAKLEDLFFSLTEGPQAVAGSSRERELDQAVV